MAPGTAGEKMKLRFILFCEIKSDAGVGDAILITIQILANK